MGGFYSKGNEFLPRERGTNYATKKTSGNSKNFPCEQQAIIHHLWVHRIFDYPNVLVSIRVNSSLFNKPWICILL
jgi:hypothetical protein